MDFDLFQSDLAKQVPIKKDLMGLVGLLLDLNSLTGECSAILAEAIRDNAGLLTDIQLEELVNRLGDTLGQVALITDTLGYELSEVAAENIGKVR